MREETYLQCCLDIGRCPVKLRNFLKFQGGRTAFCRVIEGKMPSAGHRTFLLSNLNRRIVTDRPGIVRCLKSARNFQKILYKETRKCLRCKKRKRKRKRKAHYKYDGYKMDIKKGRIYLTLPHRLRI